MGLKEPKVRNEKHRHFVASLPCCRTGMEGVQCAHIRTGNNAGMGLKSGDDCCVPLSIHEHAKQHSVSEKEYWGQNLQDAQNLAKALYEHSGNKDFALKLLDRFRWKIMGGSL